jgi:hypothetical protein
LETDNAGQKMSPAKDLRERLRVLEKQELLKEKSS